MRSVEHDAAPNSGDTPDDRLEASKSLGCLTQALIALALSVLILVGFVVISRLTEQRELDSVFSESVSSASVSLGDPDSPTWRLEWHEGSSALGGGCYLQKAAWWPLNGRSPDRSLRAIRAVATSYAGTAPVEPLPNDLWVDPERFTAGFYVLDGSPLSGGYSVRLLAAVSNDNVLYVRVYGEAC